MATIGTNLSLKLANMGFVGACLVASLHVSQQLHASGFWGDVAKYFAECGIGDVPYRSFSLHRVSSSPATWLKRVGGDVNVGNVCEHFLSRIFFGMCSIGVSCMGCR